MEGKTAGTTSVPAWVNGQIVSDDARVALDDHGFIAGDGAFETLRILDGRAFAITRHLERLRRSLTVMEIALPDLDEVRAGIERVATESGLRNGRLRVTVSA